MSGNLGANARYGEMRGRAVYLDDRVFKEAPLEVIGQKPGKVTESACADSYCLLSQYVLPVVTR